MIRTLHVEFPDYGIVVLHLPYRKGGCVTVRFLRVRLGFYRETDCLTDKTDMKTDKTNIKTDVLNAVVI